MSASTAHNAGENQDIKENFYKVKNVFDILISEASYLIDDKAYQMAEGKSQKDQFLILIDSIRKSLSIESMDDVELLVETFYTFGPAKRARLEAAEQKRLKEKEEQESNNGTAAPVAKDAKGKDAKGNGAKANPQPD